MLIHERRFAEMMIEEAIEAQEEGALKSLQVKSYNGEEMTLNSTFLFKNGCPAHTWAAGHFLLNYLEFLLMA